MYKMKNKSIQLAIIPPRLIEKRILFVRGEKVLLDSDLAELYGVETKVLNQAVKRNMARFPNDFMFRLNKQEINILRSQIVTFDLRYKRKYLPYVFTEHGVGMLSGVLNSDRAIAVNIEIMRTFVKLREILMHHANLSQKLDNLEKKYDKQFKIIFDAIRQLMIPPKEKRRRIGFNTE
jgi:hypothetical protein